MSQILNEPWAKLGEIFNSLDENNISKALKEFKEKQICVDGITSAIRGSKRVEDQCFYGLLKELGFTEKEILKIRLCIVGDCRYTTTLHGMLNHFIGYHEVPAQNVGKLISFLKDDNREMPTKAEGIKYNLTHLQMSTD